MNELHASSTVASKVRQQRQERGWSMRELAERSGLSEDVIEAIENGRRRNGVTVDELMILAHALSTPGSPFLAVSLLPSDVDYYTDDDRRQFSEWARQRAGEREVEAARRKREWDDTKALLTEGLPRVTEVLAKMRAMLDRIPSGAVIAVEQDGKLVPVEESPRLFDGDLGLGRLDVPLDHADVRPAAERHQ